MLWIDVMNESKRYIELSERGFITRKGNIVDASFVEVPRQRNHKAENEEAKAGGPSR